MRMPQTNPPSEHEHEALFVAGVSYRTAPVEVRERLAIAHPDRLEVSRRIRDKGGLSELVLLWTCNRVEIYGIASAADLDVGCLFECLAREAPILASQIYCHRGKAAVEHLYEVASGLDSMVLGETQITGQVKQAYEAAHKAKLTGKTLNRVFQKGLQTAKEIRTRTSIGRGSSSVAGVAVGHAEQILGSDWTHRRVLVIGAGQMATSCLKHLEKRGVGSITVANRSCERAEELARRVGGNAVPFEAFVRAAGDADVVIASTGSPEPILHRSAVEPLMKARRRRPLVIIDIAVPRDVDPEVGRTRGVHLHDIDALESTVQANMRHRSEDVALCRAIIETKIERLIRKERRPAPAPLCTPETPAIV